MRAGVPENADALLALEAAELVDYVQAAIESGGRNIVRLREWSRPGQGIHTPKGSRLLRQLLDELRGKLVLVYTPTYDPESNRIGVALAIIAAGSHAYPSTCHPPTAAGGCRQVGVRTHVTGDPAPDRQPFRGPC